jgi:hypothetical protein
MGEDGLGVLPPKWGQLAEQAAADAESRTRVPARDRGVKGQPRSCGATARWGRRSQE